MASSARSFGIWMIRADIRRCEDLTGGYRPKDRVFVRAGRCSHNARVRIQAPDLGITYEACETHSMPIRESIANGATGWTVTEL